MLEGGGGFKCYKCYCTKYHDDEDIQCFYDTVLAEALCVKNINLYLGLSVYSTKNKMLLHPRKQPSWS